MAARVKIEPANLRDLTFICANLRRDDERELMCQVAAGITPTQFGEGLWRAVAAEWTRIAYLDGQPACAFGAQPYNAATWIGWAFGTRHLVRTIPAVTRHILSWEPELVRLGVRRVEVRSLVGHDVAHAWLESLGCRRETHLPEYGRGGETFTQWAWTVRALPSLIRRRHVRSESQAAA